MKGILKGILVFVFILTCTEQIFAQQKEAKQAFSARDWKKAAGLYKKMVKDDDKDGKSLYRLGMCYYHLKKYDLAGATLEKATHSGVKGEVAFYNMACSYSMAKNKEKAIHALESVAVASGTISAKQIRTDSDLAYIINDPQVTKILEKMEKDDIIYSVDNPAWSPNGSEIVFDASYDGKKRLYLINADGTNLKCLKGDAEFDGTPSWSPDGTQIAFCSGAPFGKPGHRDIFVMNKDGSGRRALTSNQGSNHYPSWSPDGKKIVFNSDRDGHREVYVMNTDGTNQRRLTSTSAHSDYASYSPDGSKIVFESIRSGHYQVYLMNPDGSEQRLITESADVPRFSPDGKTITCQDARYGSAEIYLINVDGSGLRQLTDTPGFDGLSSFSPDGKKIVFVSSRDKTWNLYIMNADGTNQKKLTK